MTTNTCQFCHGAGQTSSFMGVSRFLLSWEDCPQCGGTGRVEAETTGAPPGSDQNTKPPPFPLQNTIHGEPHDGTR